MRNGGVNGEGVNVQAETNSIPNVVAASTIESKKEVWTVTMPANTKLKDFDNKASEKLKGVIKQINGDWYIRGDATTKIQNIDKLIESTFLKILEKSLFETAKYMITTHSNHEKLLNLKLFNSENNTYYSPMIYYIKSKLYDKELFDKLCETGSILQSYFDTTRSIKLKTVFIISDEYESKEINTLELGPINYLITLIQNEDDENNSGTTPEDYNFTLLLKFKDILDKFTKFNLSCKDYLERLEGHIEYNRRTGMSANSHCYYQNTKKQIKGNISELVDQTVFIVQHLSYNVRGIETTLKGEAKDVYDKFINKREQVLKVLAPSSTSVGTSVPDHVIEDVHKGDA